MIRGKLCIRLHDADRRHADLGCEWYMNDHLCIILRTVGTVLHLESIIISCKREGGWEDDQESEDLFRIIDADL